VNRLTTSKLTKVVSVLYTVLHEGACIASQGAQDLVEEFCYGLTGRVNRANHWSKGDVRLVYLGKSKEVACFAVVGSQFMFQGSEMDSFVLGKYFSYLPLNLRRGIHT
jgi:hypothetical protein